MTCTPSALAKASACWQLPADRARAAWIYLMCKWVNAGAGPTPPSNPFSWSPPSVVVNWVDVNHPGAGTNTDYPTFLATADIPTVSLIGTANPAITSFSNIASLPALSFWFSEGLPLLTSLDFTGCSVLAEIHMNSNIALTSVNFTGCYTLDQLFMVGLTSLTTVINLTGTFFAIDLSVDNGNPNLSSLSFGPCPNCLTIACYGTKLSSLDLSPLVAFNTLDCSSCLIHTPEINSILIALDSNTYFKSTPGSATMNNQTPVAPPSGLGAAAKLDLVNVWGCSITTD